MKARLAAVLGAALLGAAGPALAQAPLPDLTTAEVLARAARAAGDRRAETERESWTVRSAGLDGTLTVARRGADSASTLELGPFRTARGMVRGEPWRQNENGETVAERPEPDDRVASRTVERTQSPLDAWVVTTAFASGRATRTWFDPRTFLELRVERTVAGRTTTTVYDDFRPDARGRLRAWHYAGSDAGGVNDFDYRLARDEPGAAVADADVALPHDRRTLVELPPGTAPVRLPARFLDHTVVVRLTVAGRGLDFILDTGAGLTIDRNVARSLGLAEYGRSVAYGLAGPYPSSRVVVPEVKIGALTMRSVAMQTAPVTNDESSSVRTVGLIGFDLLAQTLVRVNFAAETVDALRPGGPPPAGTTLDLRFQSHFPLVRAVVGGVASDGFILDTGTSTGEGVQARFARAHPDAVGTPSPREFPSTVVGGSVAMHQLGRRRLSFAGVAIDDVPSFEIANGLEGADGIIGLAVLRLFTLTFDYPGARVTLDPQPPAAGGEPGGGRAATASAAGEPPPRPARAAGLPTASRPPAPPVGASTERRAIGTRGRAAR